MRALLYFLIGFAFTFVFVFEVYAIETCTGTYIDESGYSSIDDVPVLASGDSVFFEDNTMQTVTSIDPTYRIYGGYLSPYEEGCSTEVYSDRVIISCLSAISDEQFASNTVTIHLDIASTVACAPLDSDQVQNGDEEGIDCGGSTGVDCVQSCPDGYILHDGLCYKAAENPYPAGTTMPDGTISDGEPWLYPGIAADPLLHSPDYTPTPSDWDQVQDYEPAPVLPDTVEYDKSGDYVIRDENGNIVEAQIIGESVSETDNGDGTTTSVTQNKIYKDGETSITSTTTSVKDNATGEVISQYTAESSGSAPFLGSGRGSTEALTGDQYSQGVESIVDAIKDEEEGEESSWSDPEYTQTDIEYEPLDESQYDYESYIDNFISNNHDIGWLSVISDSGIQTSNPYCSISGDVSIGSTTVPLELSLCDYEDTFQVMGTWLALLVQISALIITFGGLE